jgi:hypothetical protein
VFGSAVSITKGQGGGSTQTAQGDAAYVLQLLEQRRKQQGREADGSQGQLALGAVSTPVGMHICTKVTFRCGNLFVSERFKCSGALTIAVYARGLCSACLQSNLSASAHAVSKAVFA